MIAKLRGRVAHKEDSSIIIETQGVGYKVRVTPDTIKSVRSGEEISIWTHLSVKETSSELFGFLDEESLKFFEMLISISGIGPKSALSVLSIASPEILKTAVGRQDISYLTKVSGIGKKTAQKIVLELRDKFGDVGQEGRGGLKEEADALEALQALGYPLSQAREALRKSSKDIMDTSDRIKEALKVLGK